MSGKKASKIGSLVLGLLVISLLLTACGRNKTTDENKAGQPPISPKPAETATPVTLYFSDKEAMYLVPELRELAKRDEPVEEAVIRELIKGPVNSELRRTIPPDTRLLSVSVVNGTAYLNFSGELKNTSYGGSAGEIMLIYSVVNTLSELPGITQVQFLVEGNKLETLYGHMDTSQPLGPDWNLVKDKAVKLGAVPLDFNKAQEIQTKVDNGHQPWRLDPVQVAIDEGIMLGFDPVRDRFKLVSSTASGEYSGTGEALVEAERAGRIYLIKLIQPVKQGSTGIWTINSVNEKL